MTHDPYKPEKPKCQKFFTTRDFQNLTTIQLSITYCSKKFMIVTLHMTSDLSYKLKTNLSWSFFAFLGMTLTCDL
jgi:hypothetical protein